jgi:hypothetical protein
MKYRLALRSIPPMKSAIRLMLLTGWCSHALAGSKPNIIIILVSAITQSAPPDNHLLALKVHHLRM